MEPDQITDPFCSDEPGAGFQYFIEKESVSTLSGADYIKRGISAGGCSDLLATSLFLAMLCNKIPNENGAILNLFPVVK